VPNVKRLFKSRGQLTYSLTAAVAAVAAVLVVLIENGFSIILLGMMPRWARQVAVTSRELSQCLNFLQLPPARLAPASVHPDVRAGTRL
jgi:hypothetical protein